MVYKAASGSESSHKDGRVIDWGGPPPILSSHTIGYISFSSTFSVKRNLCSNFDRSRNPCLRGGGTPEARGAEIRGRRVMLSWGGAAIPLPTT